MLREAWVQVSKHCQEPSPIPPEHTRARDSTQVSRPLEQGQRGLPEAGEEMAGRRLSGE